MYGQYLATTVRRAFQPTARITDVMQILAASAAPAVAKFLGPPVPAPDDTLAYIGLAALTFVVLRLFFVTPYQVWRDQALEVQRLAGELAKPAITERHKLAEHRAERRSRLAQMLGEIRSLAEHDYFWDPSMSTPEGRSAQARFFKIRTEARAIVDELGLEDSSRDTCLEYIHWCGVIMDENRKREGDSTEAKAVLQGIAKPVIDTLIQP